MSEVPSLKLQYRDQRGLPFDIGGNSDILSCKDVRERQRDMSYTMHKCIRHDRSLISSYRLWWDFYSVLIFGCPAMCERVRVSVDVSLCAKVLWALVPHKRLQSEGFLRPCILRAHISALSSQPTAIYHLRRAAEALQRIEIATRQKQIQPIRYLRF